MENKNNDKNNFNTYGLKGTKNVPLIVVLMTICIIALIIGLITIRNRKSKLEDYTPEQAKAMTYTQVKEGEESVEGTENVKFDAFFLRNIENDEYAESVRGTCKEIGKEDTIYMELNVQKAGYLKNAKITINAQNFYLQTTLPKDDELKNSYIGNNIKEIQFNDLKNGTQKLITGVVRSGDYSYTSSKASAIGNNIENYSKENSVTLTGTYVTETGEEIPITKTVNFNIDWYGVTRASIYKTSQSGNIDNAINEEEGTIDLDFTIYTEETEKKLILKNNHVEGTIPELNGYAPAKVIYTGTNGQFNYNEETRAFTLDKSSIIGEDKTVQTTLGNKNNYTIKVTYPLEAYQELGAESVQIKIPVETYYEGYNNPSTEFNNPYKSNTAQTTIYATYQQPAKKHNDIEIKVGKYVSEPTRRYIISKQKPIKIYNGESEKEIDDNFKVTWKVFIGADSKTDEIVLKETKDGEAQATDKFIKDSLLEESAEDIISNVGIYVTGADILLGADGYIKIYDDETGNLLGTLTSQNWNNYTSSNPYKYETPVKHIRIETSELVRTETSLYVYNIKQIDDEKITTKYEKEEFDTLDYIKSTLVGYSSGDYIGTSTHQAKYEAPISVADINISNNSISTQVTEKNEKIIISTQTSSISNQVEWMNGTFLVKLPEEIIDVKLNTVTINNRNVKLESYEIIEENGVRYIKIVTKNDIPQTYTIEINVDISPDTRISTTTKQIELYAVNENGSDYYYKAEDIYDVNNNLNKTEQVNHTTTSISMISPNSLLTCQIASKYDEKESISISPQIADIKPTYAVIDQEKEEQTVDIGVQIKNNYASNISDIQIIGKIPFEGNTYVISGQDLGSTFTTQMTNKGVEIPEELKGIAKVYYSENENPERDLSNSENGWKTAEEIQNWNNIKTFLIDLGDYKMVSGREFVFNYTVKIPDGVELNQKTYSHSGVYFSLDTENGKYRTQTEPNKLGFRIAEKYDLELQKYQRGKDILVSGATYGIKEIIKNEDGSETEGETKTGVTKTEETLKIINLYAEKTYEIKEIKSPNDYELNSDVIRFIAHVNEEGLLTIEKLEGETKEEIQIIKNQGENHKITIKVEDEVKATLKITKKEQGTENKLKGIRYKITGANLPEKGRTITTNINGEAVIKGLSINQEYTIEETKAEGYYLANPIKFKIINQEGNYVIEKIEGEITESRTTEENSIPTISITLEDEKIPTFDLEITKIKKTTDLVGSGDNTEITYLSGAKFSLCKGIEQIGQYTTDNNGKITITGLYQYETEKDIDQTYTLKEILAPDGYAKVKDITFKVENIDGEIQLQEQIEEGDTEKEYQVEGNLVKLTIEDSPTFRLIKKDKDTQETISNVKFAIYNLENGEQPAQNSKGEIIGTKETINGKEYYVVATNENGEITADLTEGLYKAVEIEAPEQYDITNQEHYFGIGSSKEGKKTIEIEWAKGIGGNSSDQITSVVGTRDGGYIVVGGFSGTIDLGNGETLTSNGSTDGMIIRYNVDGEIDWAKGIGENSSDKITSVVETREGGYLVGGYFYGTINLGNGETLKGNGGMDAILIKYNAEGEIDWAKGIQGSNKYNKVIINSVVETREGGYIIGGYFNGTIDLGNGETLKSNNSDGILIKYSAEGEIEWAKVIGGKSIDEIISVVENGDEGYLVGGKFSETIDLGNGETLTSNGGNDGMLIKYNTEGEIDWAKGIGGNSTDQITSVVETGDEGYLVGGKFSSSTIDLGNGETLKSNGGIDGMLIKYNVDGEIDWAKGIGGNSTDEINSVVETGDGDYLVGGNFSGTIDLGNGETLKNKGNLIKYNVDGEIEWAKVIGGTITSVVENKDGGYLVGGDFQGTINLGNGETLTSNGNNDALVMELKEKVIEPEILEIQELVVENKLKEYKITTDVKEINGIKGGSISGENDKVYEKVKHAQNSNKEIVMVPDENYEIIEITLNGKEYKFDVNEDGTYTMPQFTNMTEDKHIEVTYVLKANKITINKIDSITKAPLEGATFKLDQLGESDDSELYHTEVTTNSQGKALTQIPFGRYKITETKAPEGYKLNEEPIEIEFTADGNHEFTIENVEKAKVLTKHLKAIKQADGTYEYTEEAVADEELTEGEINTQYTTIPKLDIEKYELIKDEEGNYILPENATGLYVTGTTEVIYYYSEKDIPLTVHHYIEETTKPVLLKDGTEAKDQHYNGKEGNEYETKELTEQELLRNYELVETPENARGIYQGDEIIVTYYYKLRTPEIETQEITKTTETKKITNTNQLVDYNVNYKARVDGYIGKAVVTIIDKLPYEIDEQNPETNLSGGTYNKENKTITWTEEIEIQDDETSVVNITKQIKIAYKNIDPTKQIIENTAVGTIKLEVEPEEPIEPVETKEEIPTEYLINLTVIKNWEDKENLYGKRPKKITLQLIRNEEVIQENEIGEQDNWSYTFEELPKYDEKGQEIEYTVDEKETTQGDLSYYTKQIGEITNVENGQETNTNAKQIIIKNTLSKIPGFLEIRYIDILTEEEIEDRIEKEGIVGENYDISECKKDISGYKLVEGPEEEQGIYTEEKQIKIYKYGKITQATVQHIDKQTQEILKEETETGIVGGLLETHPEDFEGYILVEEPETPNIIMTEEEQIIKYYYSKISAGVLEKHIDEITGELLYNELYEGKEGDPYKIGSKEFEGYDLVTEDKDGNSRLPENAEGSMTQELIEVKYYYIKIASVKAEYIDQETGEKLTEDEIKNGHENDDYTTESKEFEKYILVKTPENATGKMKVTKNEDGTYSSQTIITYYYKKQTGKIIEKHIDINTNKILEEQEHQGEIGEQYNIPSKDFEGYELITKDKNGNSVLPQNSKGKITGEPIEIIYYYKQKAEIEIQYLEKGTNNIIYENESIKGYVGDEYETEQKEIEYYKFVESTENTKGKMTKDKIIVKYYYEKQIFNLGVDKWLSEININGNSEKINDFKTKDQIYKLELQSTKIETTDILVTYCIRISNKGEIEGTAEKIIEQIPKGYSFNQADNEIHWEKEGETLITDILKGKNIKPGESEEIPIVLRWNKGEENIRTTTNIVKISNLVNPANYKDTDETDNQAKADMILSIKTGETVSIIIIVIIIGSLIICSCITILILKREQLDIKHIKFFK